MHRVLQDGPINHISLWEKLGTGFKAVTQVGDDTLLFA